MVQKVREKKPKKSKKDLKGNFKKINFITEISKKLIFFLG